MLGRTVRYGEKLERKSSSCSSTSSSSSSTSSSSSSRSSRSCGRGSRSSGSSRSSRGSGNSIIMIGSTNQQHRRQGPIGIHGLLLWHSATFAGEGGVADPQLAASDLRPSSH